MDIKNAYDTWAKKYDKDNNKTRDMEAEAIKNTLFDIHFDNCLEIGCGTGKNTEWLAKKAKQITSVDFSEEMLTIAREKINSDKVRFVQADITQNWSCINQQYDLVTFSLVLEHIENLDDIFRKVSNILVQNGCVYIGELHPFKQYTGSKARFESEEGMQVLLCFNHNISDFIKAAKKYGLDIFDINEYFDDDNSTTIPRILTLLFKKK